MPARYEITPQEIADVTREAIVCSFDMFITALGHASPGMTANEFGEALQEGRSELEAALIHGLDQKAAELRDEP
jgi:hypothetical protein